jgi:hypothetical protein
MAKDGFDVELDDLTTFNETIQRTGEDFRDGGFQTLAALGEFFNASGLGSTSLLNLTNVFSQHMDGQLAATEVHQYTSLGLSTLALGAGVIRQSYASTDGHGAAALAKIDAGVVDKMFAPPKPGAKTGEGASQQEVDGAQQDLLDRLNRTAGENEDAFNQGIDGINGADHYLDSYDGSTVVTVPEQGGLPGQEYRSPVEGELGPDLPDIDKYDESAREDEIRDIQQPELDQP